MTIERSGGETARRVLYIDMDNVLVDFRTGIDRLEPALVQQFDNRLDEVPGIFSLMDPVARRASGNEVFAPKPPRAGRKT